MSRVLFVDDEPSVLAGLRRSLYAQRGSWAIRFVDSGPAAIAALEAEPVDVIVSDFRMPGMDGGQLLRTVRDRWPDTARIILSGHTDEDDLLKVVSVAHQVLDKPCDRAALVETVDRALQVRQRLGGHQIRAAISGLEALPSPPSALHELQAVLDSRHATAEAVARVVEGDLALTVKVLQLVNSAFFGCSSRVTSVRDAVVRLGLPTVKSLALLQRLAAPLAEGGTPVAAWLELINEQAGLTARVARDLVRAEDAADTFCAALVAECGQLAVAACRPELFASYQTRRRPNDDYQAELEADTFGVTHAQAGGYLLGLWGFPLEVIDAVAVHDQPPAPELRLPLPPAEAVRAARDLVAGRLTHVCTTAPAGPGVPSGRADLVGLLDAQIDADRWVPCDLPAPSAAP